MYWTSESNVSSEGEKILAVEKSPSDVTRQVVQCTVVEYLPGE